MPPRTIFLGRLLGIALLVLAAGGIAQGSIVAKTLMDTANDPALLLIWGVVTMVAGLAIVLVHNIWRGGLMPLVVTVLGWLLLIKGTALVVIPPGAWLAIVRTSGFNAHDTLYWIPSGVLGTYLTVAGFWRFGSGVGKT